MYSHPGKIIEEPFTNVLTLLGVELCCPHASRTDDRGELHFVICCGEHDVGRRLRVIRVDEIDEAALRDACSQTVGPFHVELIPAHMRHTQVCGEPQDGAVQKIQTLMSAEFFALGEQQVHA